MDKCTNVCGLTVAALKEAGTTGLEVLRPSGKVLRAVLRDGTYRIVESPYKGEECTSLGALKKALRKY